MAEPRGELERIGSAGEQAGLDRTAGKVDACAVEPERGGEPADRRGRLPGERCDVYESCTAFFSGRGVAARDDTAGAAVVFTRGRDRRLAPALISKPRFSAGRRLIEAPQKDQI